MILVHRGETFYNLMLYTGDQKIFVYIGFCRISLYSCGNKEMSKQYYNKVNIKRKRKKSESKEMVRTYRLESFLRF